MDKPEKDMPNKANPEKGKPEIDIHNSDKNKVQKMYSNPNDLKNLLEDIEDYESWAAGSNMFNSTTQDRITPESPDETPKAKKIPKMAATAAVPGHPHVYDMARGTYSQPTAPKPAPTAPKPAQAPTGQPGAPKPPIQLGNGGVDYKHAPGAAPEPQHGHNVNKALDILGDVVKSSEPQDEMPNMQHPGNVPAKKTMSNQPSSQAPLTAAIKKKSAKYETFPGSGIFESPQDNNGMKRVNDPMAGQHLTSIERGIMSGTQSPMMGNTSDGTGMDRGSWGSTPKPNTTLSPSMPQKQPMKNVSPNPIQKLLGLGKTPKIAADSSHPKKEMTGVVDSTIKDIQDDDALASKEIDNLLEDTHAYMEYLGLSDADESPKGSKKK